MMKAQINQIHKSMKILEKFYEIIYLISILLWDQRQLDMMRLAGDEPIYDMQYQCFLICPRRTAFSFQHCGAIMKPIDDYEWSVQFLRTIFQWCGQDILADNYRRGGVMYTITTMWILVIFCQILTILDAEHYNVAVRYTTASFVFAGIQVCCLCDQMS